MKRMAMAVGGAALAVGLIVACSSEEQAATHPPAVTPEAGGQSDSPSGGDSAGACLDETGDKQPPDCGLGNGCDDICNDASNNFKSGVAAAIASCLSALQDCDDDAKVRTCFDDAIGRACSEAGLSLYCSPLVNACAKDAGFDAGSNDTDAGDGGKKDASAPPPKSPTPFDESSCENIMRALNADGRSQLAGCVNEGNVGTCTYDPGDCIDQIRR